jgi:hypothetical protein
MGLIVAIALLLLFGIDLAVGFPFRQISLAMDIGFVICSLLLAYMCWGTFREQP